jgi:hypothetical protein
MKTKKICGNCGLRKGRNHCMPLNKTWLPGTCELCGGDSNGYVIDEMEFGGLEKSGDSVEFDMFHGKGGM